MPALVSTVAAAPPSEVGRIEARMHPCAGSASAQRMLLNDRGAPAAGGPHEHAPQSEPGVFSDEDAA